MSQTVSTKQSPLRLFPGDIVEVRPVAEILATLDANGTIDKLPFMPEMLAFCGRQFRVSRQAFKTCVDDGDMRQLDDTVLLEEVRCSGANHGSCDRGCLMFWKTAWLKRPGESVSNGTSFGLVDERQLHALAERDGKIFCQSSEIVNASKPLPWWDARQYVWDLKYNRTPLTQFAQSLLIAIYNKFAFKLKLQSWGSVTGPSMGSNGFQPLNLRPGEYVRVRPLSEIKITLDGEGKNHNLLFAPAMANYCGQVMKVRDRVENIVLEATSNQRKIKHTVLLEGSTCDGVCHRLCPRQSLLFWRECWLERLTQPGVAGATN
ncbi:MAG TPA: hypothetical protein DC054_26670 [Blastocatellia bacterium]|nr:hypothetical protein [Blastocatellia bacterium]